ncbi:MAG: hypothetical protein Q8Q23_00035 [bacterium]|nr:hypothetical protein [bacterium]
MTEQNNIILYITAGVLILFMVTDAIFLGLVNRDRVEQEAQEQAQAQQRQEYLSQEGLTTVHYADDTATVIESGDVSIEMTVGTARDGETSRLNNVYYRINVNADKYPFKIYLVYGYDYLPVSGTFTNIIRTSLRAKNRIITSSGSAFNYYSNTGSGIDLKGGVVWNSYVLVYNCTDIEDRYGQDCAQVTIADVVDVIHAIDVQFKKIDFPNVPATESSIDQREEKSGDTILAQPEGDVIPDAAAEPVISVVTCSDSDGGIRSMEYGCTTDRNGTRCDYCLNTENVLDAYCLPSEELSYYGAVNCPSGYSCRDGACTK